MERNKVISIHGITGNSSLGQRYFRVILLENNDAPKLQDAIHNPLVSLIRGIGLVDEDDLFWLYQNRGINK